MSEADPLGPFHPLVRAWFRERYGEPTAVQAAAWPLIAAGAHLLAMAPTGSGKTLAAFLGIISRLASGELPAGSCSALYVSPLKALGEDIRRNLEAPLAELAALFRAEGEGFPPITVATRSGDTSQSERRRMLSRPPSILATTPESLAIMLDTPSARTMLSGVKLLVLDEVHAVAGNKRGALLACQAGRLALLAGEYQRIALSATVGSPRAVADFVGGRILQRDGAGRASYRSRTVAIVDPPSGKRIDIRVEWPDAPADGPAEPDRDGSYSERYAAIVRALSERIDAAHGILAFTDSRRRAERLAFQINEARGETAAWTHHGSLSKELRRAVEARFKAGELACVVATASLELGIDVGSVEEVELAGAPASVSSAMQRIGRSGHGVGLESRGRIFPFHGMDLVLAAAAVRGIEERAVEGVRPISNPLDVLAQVLLQLLLERSGGTDGGSAGAGTPPRGATIDELYDIVLSFPPFAALPRPLFDPVVEMLAGRYAGSRIRELEPRILIDRASGLASAREGIRQILYMSGGSIPDRGLYSMRLAGSRAKIGELDEEFVWERRVGDSFALGSQVWRIVAIGDEAVEVAQAARGPDIVPFWKGETGFRSPALCARALELLDALAVLDEEGGEALLVGEYRFSPDAARACARFAAAQKAAGGGKASLPGTRLLPLEILSGGSGRGDFDRLALHSLRGLAVNQPLGMAISGAWEAELGLPVRFYADDDSILFSAPRAGGGGPGGPEDDRALGAFMRALERSAARGELERLVRARLEGTGLFGAQFRENAGRSLLLPRGMPGRRVPLWISRLRAKKLFDAVRGYEDFPVVAETWRSCLSDFLDVEGAAELSRALVSGAVSLSAFSSAKPSPLARESGWKEVGDNMYRSDELEARPSSSISDRVIAEALRSSASRPRLSRDLVLDYERRLKRLLPSWGPEDGISFAEWVKERVAVPAAELPEILAASRPGLAQALEADPSCGGRVARIRLRGASEELFVHAERRRELEDDPAALLAEWLRREALVPVARIAALFGLEDASIEALLDELDEEGTVVVGALVDGSAETCAADADNFETLMRRARNAARPSVQARPREDLFRLVAAVQGLSAAPSGNAQRALLALEGCPMPVAVLESEIMPPRSGGEGARDILDAALASGEWQWFGAGKETVALARTEDLELFLEAGSAKSRIVPPGEIRDFWALRELTGLPARETALALWAEAWKGLVASDSFAALRDALANGFGRDLPASSREGGEAEARVSSPLGPRRRIPRALRERWRGGAPVAGRWFRLELEESGSRDALDDADLEAARARILVSRWGIVCRELLERELPCLRWGRVFTALRRLELSGELLAGRFFEGVDGPQFMGTEAFRLFGSLKDGEGSAPMWLNATDPAAAALPAVSDEGALAAPSRLAANRVCVLRGFAVAASTRSHRDLLLSPAPGDPRLPAILEGLASLKRGSAQPGRRLLVETVNGEAASRCPYASALREAGFEADRGRMLLW